MKNRSRVVDFAVVIASFMLLTSSCEKDFGNTVVDTGYFVQLSTPYISEMPSEEFVTACLFYDRNCLTPPCEIVGKFNCSLPETYQKGDTVLVEATLKRVYPIIHRKEMCAVVGPYFKLKKIVLVNN